MRCEKGQIYTLEGVIASTLMISVLVFSVQATSITPLTSSSANEHIEAQLQFIGNDVLNTLDYGGSGSSLKSAVLSWAGSTYTWNGTHYVSQANSSNTMNNTLTTALNFTLVRLGIAHNVELVFLKSDSDCIYNRTSCLDERSVILSGEPSNNAVIVSHKIVLHNSDITDSDAFSTSTGIGDFDPSTDLYNIVDFRLIVWRM